MISLYVDTLMRIFRVMFAPRSNYIHLMCEFLLVPIHCPLFWDFTARDMCVKRFMKLVISRVITYNGTSPPKVVHKSRKWTIAHSNVRKRIFWVLRQWKREMICLRKFIVCCVFRGTHLSGTREWWLYYTWWYTSNLTSFAFWFYYSLWNSSLTSLQSPTTWWLISKFKIALSNTLSMPYTIHRFSSFPCLFSRADINWIH